MENLLTNYRNGNTAISIFSDGTKVRQYEGDPSPYHPESIDVKITDFCDLGCPYCHESSTEQGKHGDLALLLDVLDPLPAGVELAIGGGNPLSHPFLGGFLTEMKERGLICNLTVNQGHLSRYGLDLEYLLNSGLVRGLGISITGKNFDPIKPLLKISNNIVYHVIAGVNHPEILQELGKLGPAKTLVLGYKTFGRGISYENPLVMDGIKRWYQQLGTLITDNHLSFDNLAIEQLRLKRLFTDEGWQRFYMGDDGEFTMYIDAVLENYAKTSRCYDRVPFSQCSILNFFQGLRESSGRVRVS